jgi:1-acyl-sn-glycerol-3-phosphate acyltransferase
MITESLKVISLFFFILMLFINSCLLILPFSLVGKSQLGYKLACDLIQSYFDVFYNYGLNSKIKYLGNIKFTDKIDVLVCNHVNTFDFAIYLSVLKQFCNKEVYIICRNNLKYIPIFGFYLKFYNFIKINKNLETDKYILTNAINKIDSGVIIIMPEGTRFTEENYKKSKEYSNKNNLTQFENLLYPKMKGLHIICDILNKNNKLGNIIDFTIKIDKMFLKKCHIKDIITNNLGDSLVIINNYKINKGDIDNYELFKQFFIKKWIKKDKILNNTKITHYNESHFKTIIPSVPFYKIYLSIILILTFINIIKNSSYLLLPTAIIIMYAIIITTSDINNN